MSWLEEASQFWLHLIYLQQASRRRDGGVYRAADRSVRKCAHCQSGRSAGEREYHHCDKARLIVHRGDSCMQFVLTEEEADLSA